MTEDVLIRIVLAVIVGVLFGIVYSMRVLVLMERRVAKIERHIESMLMRSLKARSVAKRVVRRKKVRKRRR